MEYNSFYGGKMGFSPVIVKNYKTINAPETSNESWNKIIRIDLGLAEGAEISTAQRKSWLESFCMVEAFKLGDSYTTVHYDEHVIINTPSLNDIDNGKVFQRGYNFKDALGGAIYIGQIVGPSGAAPHTTLDTFDNTKELFDKTTEGDYRKKEGEFNLEDSLVPGKDEEGNFNDTIKYISVSIRDEESKESEVVIGFKIPYLTIDYTAKLVGEDYSGAFMERVDSKEHPFYEKWELSIPKASSFKNIRIITAAAGDGVEPYPQQEYDREHSNRIIVYDKDMFDEQSQQPIVKTFYLGVHDVVKNTEINWFSYLGVLDPNHETTGISWGE